METISWLFNTTNFLARECCAPSGKFPESLQYVLMISDSIIFLAYFSIALILYLCARKMENVDVVGFWAIFLTYAAFILFCGVSHLVDALAFDLPFYRFNGVVRVFTATISVIAVFVSLRYVPHAFLIPKTLKELIERKEILKTKIGELKKENAALQEKIATLES